MSVFALLAAALSATIVGVRPAIAQQTQAVSPELEAEYDAAFQEMLKNPSDLDVLFKFATIASKTGDLEGAISALERMLLVDPDLPRVRLELGVLYYRLGSFEVARSYFEVTLKSASLPPDVKARAEQFLAESEKRLTKSRFTGEIFAGMRYQSNANLGPPTSSVRLFGQTANLNQTALGTADWGAVTSGFLRHIYDLGQNNPAQLETQLSGYLNRQFQIQAANVSILDLTSGPRFKAFNGIFEDVTLKPFGTVGYIWVNDVPYYGSFGSGLEVGTLLSDKLRNTTNFVWRRQMYQNTWYIPTNNQFTGVEYSANSTFQYAVNQAVMLYANGNLQRYQTDSTPWQNYMLYGVGGGMSFSFTDPLFKSELPWSISLFGNVQWWYYDQPDAVVDPTVTRQQIDTILNLTLSIPFDQRTMFTVSGGRFVRSSDIPNYAFTNNSALIGVTWRF
ncbi:tetratricopeptide repeat protein [Reyranella aquatilis]|uniref:Tetratricopeptide repeat protein n=1 Tax=Reyranella aquatilis TaxID=2035356 RepID=A0ABS8KQZ8_9HYPH|nr:tetratricopeptide repeat protein [Reyranella aquatilis]MCC8428497.1 tetratricopeptide repeat protein [Reyranella aquatilis]